MAVTWSRFLGSTKAGLLLRSALGNILISVLFFSSFSLGIIIEDGIRAAWRRLTGRDRAKSSSPKEWAYQLLEDGIRIAPLSFRLL